MAVASSWFVWFWILIALFILSFCICAVSTLYSCCPYIGRRGATRDDERRYLLCCFCCNRPSNNRDLHQDGEIQPPELDHAGRIREAHQVPSTSRSNATEKAKVKALMLKCKLIRYSKSKSALKMGKSGKCKNDMCPVCLEAYKDGDTLVLCPCKHGYHVNCLEGWLRVKHICPLCKGQIFNECDETSPLLYAFV